MEIDNAAEQRFNGFIDLIGGVLQYPQRRENFARYALGLIVPPGRNAVARL